MVCFNLPFGSLHPNSVDQNMLFQSNWAAQKQHQVLLEPSACHPAKQHKTKIVKRMWIKLKSAFWLLLHYTSFIYWQFFFCFFSSNFDDIGLGMSAAFIIHLQNGSNISFHIFGFFCLVDSAMKPGNIIAIILWPLECRKRATQRSILSLWHHCPPIVWTSCILWTELTTYC